MRQAKLTLLFTLLMGMVCIEATAAFGVANSDGVTIYYEIINDGEVSVSKPNYVKYYGSVVIPETVTYKGKTYSVTTIGEDAFEGCSGLTNITIPNSVTTIGHSTFSGCSALTSITIPNSVTSIGDRVFSGCSGLTNINIPNSVTTIGDEAFYNCSELTSINIPNSVTSIGDKAFYFCTRLTSINIPNSVTSIGDKAFYYCKGLTNINIPNSVTSIGDRAFSGCSDLTSISVESGNTKYDSRNNCNALIETATNTLIAGCINTTIPNSVTTIGDEAFSGSALTSINIPNSVTTIGDEAFYGSALTSINIPNSVTSIGEGAFSYCISLTSITIPNSVTSIGDWAFCGCFGLTNINIPNSVTTIGDEAFYGCFGLTNINIPNSVTTIGDKAFYDCFGLTNINIPNSVTTIGSYAFYNCSGLTSINIPNSVTTIGHSTFSGCPALTRILVEPGNSKYDSRNDCNAIIETASNTLVASCKNTIIPNSVTTIGYEAFYYCQGLTSINIPNSVTTIGDEAFYNCSELTSINIPNSVTTIGDEAFFQCTRLTSINIPNSVKTIGGYAFFYCQGLTSVNIPNSVTSIGDYAFYGCDGLTSVTSYIDNPFPINLYYVFGNSSDKASLYVPAASLELYKTTEGWKNFKNIIPLVEVGRSLALKVIDKQNNDVTNHASITWYDADKNQIGTGNDLKGIADSATMYYSIALDEEFGRTYREVTMQKIVAETDTIICQLAEIGRVVLEGRVSATDIDRTAMTVNVKQQLNGKWEQDYTTQTNEQGAFRMEVYDDQTDITISGDGYFDATLHRDGFDGNGNVGTIPMNLISGFAIAANITLQQAVTNDQAEETVDWTGGLNNIEFALYNETKNTSITDFATQNENVIIKSGAEIGDEIRLTAKSKQGIFAETTTLFTIEAGANSFNLTLTELGGIDITYASSSNGTTIGYLYDANNKLAARGSYAGETLSLRHIKSGTYTLVSMGSSTLLGNMPSMESLQDVGLQEGSDYVATSVTVADGSLTATTISAVPSMDDTRFYYTSGNTYFNANKESLTAGNYLTLTAHLDFKPEYSDKADVVKLSIDIPEGCQIVENSVIANRQAVAHTIDGNRLTMTLNKDQWQGQVRFCIIPVLNQTYTITAMASFDMDGNVLQPIGTAQFEAKGLSLSTPKYAANTNITIHGTAKGHSEVRIYDNDVLIGTTSSKADGSWTATCELYKPYAHSFHDIYAKIVADDGMELTSETKQVEYEKNLSVPQKVTMTYYNGWYKKNKTVEFNLLEGTTTPASYPFYSGTDFTFLAEFTRNDSTLIKNVNIKVLNSDGTVRTLPATFDGKQNKWVATTKYSNSSRLPQNVAVEYDVIPSAVAFNPSCVNDDNNQYINLIKNFVSNVDSTKIEVLKADESMMICKYQTYSMEEPVYIRLEVSDYNKNISKFIDTNYFTMNNGDAIYYVLDSIVDNRYIDWVWNNEAESLIQMAVSKNNDFSTANIKTQTPRRINMFDGTRTLGNLLGKSVLNLFCNAGDIYEIINDYNMGYNEYQDWLSKYNKTLSSQMQLYDKTKALLYAKCPDGSNRLTGASYYTAKMRLENYFNNANNMRQQFQKNLDRMERDLIRIRNFSSLQSACGALVGICAGLNVAGSIVRQLGSSIVFSAGTTTASDAYNMLLKNQFYTADQLSDWYFPASSSIIRDYTSLQDFIRNSYKTCKKKEEKDKEEKNDEPRDEKTHGNKNDFNGKGSTPEIDPSGYVYEAVLSNRLEGVTATCYQKVQKEDMYGDITEEAEMWNAEDFSQQNPLKTDADGFYRWDVPQGMWQVKYEKEGYETAYSEWLPVPPPQLDVNIGMKQSTPPTVKQMRGYESGITIETSKYMRPATLNTTNVTVTRNGMDVKGSIDIENAEKEPRGDAVYASKIKFIPEMNFETTDEVIVTVHKEVESYCGVNMVSDFVQKVEIEPEIKEIVADSVISIPYQGSKTIQVVVLPKTAAMGKTLRIHSSSAMIAAANKEEITLDENGSAMLTLNGELPGSAFLTFAIDNTDMQAQSKVKVVMENDMVATPIASITSGLSVDAGTQLTLTCETEGATIYYTLDGSCPCDEAKRIKYEAPIVIDSDVIVKAIAVKGDMDDSDIATFVYLINDTGIESIGIAGIRIWPLVTSSTIHIDLKDLKAENITVVNMNGAIMYSAANVRGRITIDLGRYADGMYIVNVKCKDGRMVRKIVKIRD